jgi:hypothetical protein
VFSRRRRDEGEREENVERRNEAFARRRGSHRSRSSRDGDADGEEAPSRMDRESRRARATGEETTPERDPHKTRLDSLRVNVSSLLREADGAQERISDLDDRIGNLQNRVSRIRGAKYSLMGHLEGATEGLSSRWGTRAPSLKEDAWSRASSIRSELEALSSQLSALGSPGDSELSMAESRLGGLRGDVSRLVSFVDDELNEFDSSYEELDSELNVAENTTELLSQPSFEWKKEEHPVVAIRAHHLDDDVHGVLTLTNQRFIFEGEKEVVLKKTLFIATEKKTVREVVIDRPIGSLEAIDKGRVGLFKGAGLYVRFKPETGLGDVKFDTRGSEGDQVIRNFEYINSGEADNDLAEAHGEEEEEREAVPVVCPICSAPYTAEIYRGQTSLECKYCGAAIRL